MTAERQDAPTTDEKIGQLRRILASSEFKTSATQRRLLRFVAKQALANKPITQADILIELYGVNVDAHSTNAKATANLVRRKIESYYQNEGKNDLVRIDLPAGPGYRPEFSFNISAEAIQAYKKALSYKNQISAFALSEAQIFLERAIKAAPEYAPLFELEAEIHLLRFVLESILESYPGASRWTQSARESAEKAVHLNPRSWSGHALLGVVSMFNNEFRKAKSQFSISVEMDPRKGKANLWYATFLMVAGSTEEALEIARTQASNSPGSFEVKLIYAFFLYTARFYNRAWEVLFEVVGEGAGETLQHLMEVLIRMADGRSIEDIPHDISDISNKLDRQWDRPTRYHTFRIEQREDVPWNDGVTFPNLPKFLRATPSGEEMVWWNPTYDPSNRFPGLLILSLATKGELQEAELKMAVLRRQRSVRALQLVLGYMAVGNHARAVASLLRACKEGELFFNWIHLLPLFDPLRDHPRFQWMERYFLNLKNEWSA